MRLKTSDKDFVEKLQNSKISNKNVAVNNVKQNFQICLKYHNCTFYHSFYLFIEDQ